MRLLLDANLSYKLVQKLDDLVETVIHVAQVGLGSAPDQAIWDFARDNNLSIATKDEDFIHLSHIRGFPPKVLWLRVGNLGTGEIERHIQSNFIEISHLLQSDVGVITIEEGG